MIVKYLEGIFWLTAIGWIGCVGISALRVSSSERTYQSEVLNYLDGIRSDLDDISRDTDDLAEHFSYSAYKRLSKKDGDA